MQNLALGVRGVRPCTGYKGSQGLAVGARSGKGVRAAKGVKGARDAKGTRDDSF